MIGYCPKCGQPCTTLLVNAKGYCPDHGWVWVNWNPPKGEAMTRYYAIDRHDGIEMCDRLAARNPHDALRQFRDFLFENNPQRDKELHSFFDGHTLYIRNKTYTAREVGA